MVDAGAQCVYVVDSAGALVLDDAQERVAGAGRRDRRTRRRSASTATRTSSLGVANSVLAYQARRPADRRRAVRARRRRGQLAHRGAGRRRSTGWASRPASTSAACSPPPRRSSGRSSPRWPKMDRAVDRAGLGRRLLARSCCTPSARPSATACPPTRSCSEVGEAGYVGGQEDMIIDIAVAARPGARPGATEALSGAVSRTSSTARSESADGATFDSVDPWTREP